MKNLMKKVNTLLTCPPTCRNKWHGKQWTTAAAGFLFASSTSKYFSVSALLPKNLVAQYLNCAQIFDLIFIKINYLHFIRVQSTLIFQLKFLENWMLMRTNCVNLKLSRQNVRQFEPKRNEIERTWFDYANEGRFALFRRQGRCGRFVKHTHTLIGGKWKIGKRRRGKVGADPVPNVSTRPELNSFLSHLPFLCCATLFDLNKQFLGDFEMNGLLTQWKVLSLGDWMRHFGLSFEIFHLLTLLLFELIKLNLNNLKKFFFF